MKNDNGITLIALIVTIIVLLILATTITYTSMDTYQYSKANKFVKEMQLIQKEVDTIVEEGYNSQNPLGETLTTLFENHVNAVAQNHEILEVVNNDYRNYRYFSKQKIWEQLNIEDAMGDIIVNFATREVISLDGIEYEGQMYYTQYQLPNGQIIMQHDNSNATELAFNTNTIIDGLEAKIQILNITRDTEPIINYVLRYKLLLDDEQYSTYQEYDEDSGYWTNMTNNEVKITKSGKYVIALTDKNNTTPYFEEIAIKLANKPEDNDNFTKVKYNSETSFTVLENEQWYDYSQLPSQWAYVEDRSNSKLYIWIPRLAYDELLNIKFLKGSTNISTDNVTLTNQYIISEKFTGNNELGIWEEVNGVITTPQDIVNILENM